MFTALLGRSPDLSRYESVIMAYQHIEGTPIAVCDQCSGVIIAGARRFARHHPRRGSAGERRDPLLQPGAFPRRLH
jgi:hypothetical protein